MQPGRCIAVFLCISSVSLVALAEPGDQATIAVGAGAQVAAEDSAQPKPAAQTAAKSAATKADSKNAPSSRRDPKGKKGISPYWEAIRRGDEAALARDFAKAEEAYQTAIALDSRNPLGHFRRGQVQLRAGRLTDAEVTVQDAMRLADKDPTLHAAALFVLADLKERQGQRDAAIAAWKAYADYLHTAAAAKGYPETATERDKRLKKYNELLIDGKAVRERIQLRIKELEESNRRKAAQNPNAGK